jgi:hypothetical protein
MKSQLDASVHKHARNKAIAENARKKMEEMNE